MGAVEDYARRRAIWVTSRDHPDLVSKDPILQKAHNERAAMLRAGLIIRGFALLETFVRRRTAEALAAIDPNTVLFDDLPEPLRDAATLSAIDAIRFQARMKKQRGDDYLEFIQAQARIVATGMEAAYAISGYSFLHNNSNVNASDLPTALKSVGVNGGWESMSKVASRAGLGIPGLADVFKGLARKRNAAAHDDSFEVPFADLADLELELTAVALSYDSLLSRAVTGLRTGAVRFDLTDQDVSLRFLRPTADGKWREVREGAARAHRVYDDLQAAWAAACVNSAAMGEVLVEQNLAGVPTRWRAGHW